MKLLRTKQVVQLTGLSRMTLYRLEKAGSFPSRRQLGCNSVAWLEDDVAAWVSNRPRPGMPMPVAPTVADRPPPAYTPLMPRPRPSPQQRRVAPRRPRRRPAVQVDLPLDEPASSRT
jgi:prophage regulatory protein